MNKPKMTRGKKAGITMADALIEFINLMYNAKTAIRVLDSLIEQLTVRRRLFHE